MSNAFPPPPRRAAPSNDFVPLRMTSAENSGHGITLARHPIRIGAVVLAFLTAAISTVALIGWLIPEPRPSLILLFATLLCPASLILAGAWLIVSIHSGYRMGTIALGLAVVVTALWWVGKLGSLGDRISVALVLILPALIFVLLGRYLMTLRREQIMRPIL